MAELFKSNTKSSVFRSISTILTGGVFLFVPGLTMKTVIIILGAMLMLSGFATFVWTRRKKVGFQSGFLSAQGIINMLFGMIFILAPSVMIKLFMVFIGIILLIMGFLQLAGSLGSLMRSVWAWLFLIIGLFTFGSGLYLLSNPFKSAEAILPFLGVLLILNGFSDLFRTWKADRQPTKYNGTDVQDIPFEEV